MRVLSLIHLCFVFPLSYFHSIFCLSSLVFFLRAIAECFARLSNDLGIGLSVRLSVRHTAVLYQNGARYDN